MAETTHEKGDKLLFYMSWTAIVATAFGFAIRSLVVTDWGTQFNLSQTDIGNLNGVGLWPFAISIAAASMIIDKIGFRAIFTLALVCHLISLVVLLTAGGYTQLFWGTFIFSFGNGCIEAAANPLVASVYKENRVRWLNYLHSGWAGGLTLSGLLVVFLDLAGVNNMTGFGEHAWKLKIGLMFIPMVIYGLLMIGRRFPVTERVAANVSYKDMLKDAGGLGSFAVSLLGALAIVGIFTTNTATVWTASAVIAAIIGVIFFVYTKSLGRPLYLLILVMMMPQAITELGTASWVANLLGGQMAQMALDVGWVTVATNVVLLLMRVYGSAVVHKVSPVGMLCFSAFVSALSMIMFAYAHGPLILVGAALFGLGTAFFWPTTLGFVSEQFPRSGSVGINFVGAAGMLAAGTIGATLMGTVQDKANQDYLLKNAPAAATQVLGEQKSSLIGAYRPIDKDKAAAVTDPATSAAVADATANGQSLALKDMAILPGVLFILYLILFIVFRSRGGYRREVLEVSDEAMANRITNG